MRLGKEQRKILIKLIGEKRNILFNERSSTVKRNCWEEIVQQCRDDYNFNPVPDDDWRYLRDNHWHYMRKTALRRKTENAPLSEIDAMVLAILDDSHEPFTDTGDSAHSAPTDDDDNNSNNFFKLEDADDVADTADSSSINNALNRRTRSSHRAHPYIDTSVTVPITVRPAVASSSLSAFLANGAIGGNPILNGIRVESHGVEDNLDEPNDDDSVRQRNLQLQNRVLEAQLELLKSQAQLARSQAELARIQAKSQADLAKSQTEYWKKKTEAVCTEIDKRNLAVRNGGKLEDADDDQDDA